MPSRPALADARGCGGKGEGQSTLARLPIPTISASHSGLKSAPHLGISAKTLRIAAESAAIEALHPLPGGPWIFSRVALDGPAAQAPVKRARRVANPRRRTV
jgi:hypothetical protein